ncbi:sarcosine oxidase subunit delta [Hyphomicrobium sp. MC1]|uniref:sarcosine oxidase subunit delta n=1 Tax=Hyphomicrobium sp. (strain MC1) TaxID=717785 RepID=UPI000213D83E|nr:sarcosine oxidase subunit delta [Hyphomicrobium sp. MC1]CCB65080.1 putative N-methyl glutamate dehydrogenase/oxidoreductase subunit B [Hyphomicrobium sp. MC1]
MFVLFCPHCQEKREEEEFGYAGEAFRIRPPTPETVSDEAWGDYLFMRTNPKGWHWELWSHATGCRKFLVVKRNTATNTIAGSWTLAEGRKAYDAEGGAQ